MIQRAMSRRAFTSLIGTAAAGLLLGAAGCATTKKMTEVPLGADKVRTTKGEPMEYVADRHGEVVVWDDDTAKVLLKEKINNGDKVVVDPKADMLMFNDKDLKVHLDRTHRYNIYVK